MQSLLRMLLVCISIYLKLILRYKFLILDTYKSGHTIYVSKHVRIRSYFLNQNGPASKNIST